MMIGSTLASYVIYSYEFQMYCTYYHTCIQVTGFGEKIRWYNNKKIPDRVFNILKLLTIIVDSLWFKVTMSKYIHVCVAKYFVPYVSLYF